MARQRVAVVGMRHEAMLACPFLTDPSTTDILRGEAMRTAGYAPATGVFERLDPDPEVEAVPLLVARTLPGGPFARGFYEAIRAESLDLLRRHGPFDAVLVLNHGAAEVDGLSRHGDTDYILAVRELVGPGVPIAVPFDMHGQVTPEALAAIDTLSCLRTAPHRDYAETSWRAADELVRVMRGNLRTGKASVHIPILIPGEMAMTAYEPARELFGMLADYDRRPGIMGAHLFVGFGWNDRPWSGMQAVVVAERDQGLAAHTAEEIAERVWAARERFGLAMETAGVREGLTRAQAARERPFFLSDAGDNVTAGAGGDLTFVLQEALALGLEDVVVGGIFAPDVVEACRGAASGTRLSLSIGQHVTARPQPLTVEATLEAFAESLDVSRFPGLRPSPAPWCRVRIGGIVVTFHAARVGLTGLGHFQAMGIDPLAPRLTVVKLGYLHPQLEDVAARHICLVSEGVADLDLRRLTFKQVVRPAHPLDPGAIWSPRQGLFPRITDEVPK